jgi:hypothetical protein
VSRKPRQKKLKQSTVGSDASINDICGENLISSGATTICADTTVVEEEEETVWKLS